MPIKDVVEAFLQVTPQNIVSIKSLIKMGDLQAADDYCHKIKGAASNVAAQGFVDAIIKLQASLKSNDAERHNALLEKLEGCYHRLENNLKDFLATQNAECSTT